MAEKDLPSSSDESDEDFVPENEIHESLSEESHSSDNEEAEGETSNKKKKVNRKRRKDKEEEKEQEEPEAKKKEIDINALWADFKEDVNQKKLGTNMSSNNVIADKKNSDEVKKTNLGEDKKEKLDETQVKKLPGKNIPSFSNKTAPGKGLASVLNKIGKKDKLSTLEKSKLDWNKFKQSEGIDEEIKTFNRGKDGYLEKQDFLQRTDLRQFEIEKQLRTTKRSFR